ncbi:hypothetical protein BGZ99_008266 [Dissophora globulifera]|uniref:Uncharacterized protein n=1 Tax=Dissophora globulifera TaxID=979702 RepID=A0A9P6RBE6_9FUNG|nr:hypothetical protein BGZ99_008266 [Dissophora globulifera]
MASILFDDISFPRELYNPDTLEFVPPVSVLLDFTPHILSQLAKTSENEQEPIPLPSKQKHASSNDNPEPHSETAAPSSPDATSSAAGQQQQARPSSSGLFSTLQNFATSQSTRKILENGLYFAGRYIDGAANRAASGSSSRQFDERQSYSNSSTRSRDDDDRHREQRSYWFGRQDSHDQERERLRDMEHRLQQMEREMRQNSATARSEIDTQRRERHRLEQELEAQKQKVKKMEADMEETQKAAKVKQEEQRREAAQQAKSKEKGDRSKEASSEGKEETDTLLETSAIDHTSLAANTALMASVGAVSLAMSLYSAHKASSSYSAVTFHNQLEELMAQCEGVIQSTEAWMSEQILEVPDQIREDLKMIKELMETIQRLDPRSEKKAETIAWSMSAVGSLGAVGGAVLGSMTAMASGGTIVIGCALYGIVNRTRYNGPEYKGARAMMELKAAQTLRSLGVNPSSNSPASSASGGTRTRLIRDSRIERLRLEFERRDGHDVCDADEIDGLAVEDTLKEFTLSASPVPLKMSGSGASKSRQQNCATTERKEDHRPTLTMKREAKRAVALNS